MRRLMIAVLAAAMLVGTVTDARAVETSRQITANHRGRGRPQPRRDRGGRHQSNRRPQRHKSNSGWGWAIAGAVIGGAIASGIANSSRPAEPVLVCDAYGNCYYTYR